MQPFHPQQSRSSTSFRPATPDSPSFEKESHIGSDLATRQARQASDDVVRDYADKRANIDKALELSKYVVADVKNVNKEEWHVQYPSLKSAEGGDHAPARRPGLTHQHLSYADEPSRSMDVVVQNSPTGRRTIRRTHTEFTPSAQPSSSSSIAPASTSQEDDFSILRLDLNMGATRHAKRFITHLEKASISALIDTRLTECLDHLVHLHKRIHDPQSRVLVTGDLNAGKSTLVNALLRRGEVMPIDEQPLTTRFVEVVSAKENKEIEEIHVLAPGRGYDVTDQTTYSIEPLEKLESLVADMETDASSAPLRVYLKEASSDIANPSILHNGIVDISLIDAPGLNRDSLKTTANFARQEEIDVVVFVVSAANHFTLSAKEFIWQAGHEKAHLFIVVNRFDQIKDKERCRRLVMDQIKQLSPKTYEDAADLVHFVDSAKIALNFADDEAGDDFDQAFSHLEHSLRSFVLINRSKSKLGPAHNYITRLMSDVELLANANILVAEREREVARGEIARVKPELEKMKKGKDGLDDSLGLEENKTAELSASPTKQAMTRGLERIGRGELAAPGPGLELPAYAGILGVFDFAREVKRVMIASLDFAVTLAENDARHLTSEGVDRITQLGEKYLPADAEKSKRVFNPGAMFARRPTRPSRRSSGVMTIGLGLANQSHLLEVSFADIFDVHHHLFLARSQLPTSTPSSSRELIPFTPEVSGIGAASLAFGALSLVSGKTMGVRSIIESAVSVSDIISSPAARKWIGPVIGVAALGTVAYVVYELPRSIPRNVGRHLQASLLVSSGTEGDAELVPFVDAVSSRISNEVRKVIRLGGWEVRERYRGGLDSRAEVVRENEKIEKRATAAIERFAGTDKQVQEIRAVLAEVKI